MDERLREAVHAFAKHVDILGTVSEGKCALVGIVVAGFEVMDPEVAELWQEVNVALDEIEFGPDEPKETE